MARLIYSLNVKRWYLVIFSAPWSNQQPALGWFNVFFVCFGVVCVLRERLVEVLMQIESPFSTSSKGNFNESEVEASVVGRRSTGWVTRKLEWFAVKPRQDLSILKLLIESSGYRFLQSTVFQLHQPLTKSLFNSCWTCRFSNWNGKFFFFFFSPQTEEEKQKRDF